jgi:hypothetical protein
MKPIMSNCGGGAVAVCASAWAEESDVTPINNTVELSLERMQAPLAGVPGGSSAE